MTLSEEKRPEPKLMNTFEGLVYIEDDANHMTFTFSPLSTEVANFMH